MFRQELLEGQGRSYTSDGVHPPVVVEDGCFERVIRNSGKASGRSSSSVKKASGSQVVSERQLQRALRWVEADRWKRQCQSGLLGFLGLIQAWGGGCVFAWVDVR